jgi:hypothetical protein
VTLETPMPADPGLRFYATRPLARLELAGGETPRRLLVWEDDWRRLRDAAGEPLRSLVVSEARQSRHGPLVLVEAPAGNLTRVPPPAPAAREPGLRTGSRSP